MTKPQLPNLQQTVANTQVKTLFSWLRVLIQCAELGFMNIELAPEVQLRMKHLVSGLNEIALTPFI